MKKNLAFLFFYFFLYSNIFACSCCYFTTTFCGNVEENSNNKVALLAVQKLIIQEPYYQQIMVAKVVDDLFDNINTDTITVFGADGGNCNENFSFGEKDTILMQLYEHFGNEFLENEFIKGTIFQNGGCGVSFLKYKSNNLTGSILPEVSKVPYDSFIQNLSKCQTSPSFIDVFGKITDWRELDKGIQIDGMEINGLPIEQLDTNGNYRFKYLELTQNSQHKLIEPYSNNDILKGVSTKDIITIRKHILGLDKLNTPWQKIAADVNNSSTITMLDIIQIRKVILGLQKVFVNNSSWRFTGKGHIFQSEFPLKENFDAKLSINTCSEDTYNVDLIAIKIGDVDGIN